MKKLMTVLLTIVMAFSCVLAIKADDVEVEEPDCENGCGFAIGSGIFDAENITYDNDGNFTGTKYSSLQEAFDNIADGGGIFVSALQYSESQGKHEHAVVPEGKTINLYVDSFLGNVDGSSVIENNGTLIIEESNYSLFYANDGVSPIVNNGTLTIGIGNKFSSDVSSLLSDGYKLNSTSRTYWFGTDVETEETFNCYEVIKSTDSNTPEVVNPNNAKNDIKEITDADNGFDSNDVSLKVEMADTTPSSEDKAKVDAKIKELQDEFNELDTSTEYEITNVDYVWLDVNMYAVDTNGNKAKVTEFNNEIGVTIYLDDSTLAKVKGKEIYVGRIHGDEQLVLSYATLTGNALTFYTSKFSTFAIVTFDLDYEDITEPSDNNNSSTTSVSTKTEANTPCEEWNHSKDWTWSESQGKCVYRVSNTSAK